MAKNMRIKYEATLECAVAAGVKSGDPVIANGQPGVALTDEGGGVGNVAGRASVAFGGVWDLPCADVVAAEDTALYLTADRAVTTTAAGNTLFGRSVSLPNPVARSGGTKAAGAGTITVRLVRA